MGQLLNPLLLGVSGCHDLLWACTSCQACKANCPAGIDHPGVMHYLKTREAKGDSSFKALPPALTESLLFKIFTQIASNPVLWKQTGKIARRVLNLRSDDESLTKAPKPLSAWLKGRNFPKMPDKTFHERWKEIKKEK
jgi:L-lactate dehydrogenase complex protein LldF